MEFMIFVVLIVHGIGIIGGLGGFISAIIADDNLYGDNIALIFPARLMVELHLNKVISISRISYYTCYFYFWWINYWIYY